MVTVYIKSINSQGNYQEFSVGRLEFEEAVDLLNQLVRHGVTLRSISYASESHKLKDLPVAAFDGKPTKEGIQQLRLEWEAALC